MVGEDKKYIRSWEELIMDRLGQAFHAKDQQNAELFDSIVEESEMLLKLVPAMYNELQAVKEHKRSLVVTGMKQAQEKAQACPDDITKEFVYRKEVYAIEWDYRTDMLEAILTILGAYQKIPFANPERAEMAAIRPVVEEKEEPVAETPKAEATIVEPEEPKKQPTTFTPVKDD